jgi:hypothetical protein
MTYNKLLKVWPWVSLAGIRTSHFFVFRIFLLLIY